MIHVVLPAYNEADALPPLLSRLKKASLGHLQSGLSVIVVDDGSADGTAEVARSAGGSGLEVRVLVHPQNRGLSDAIRTGLVAAVEQAGDDDVIVTMDADDTQGPGLISRMTMLIEEGNDVVVASRYAPGGRVLGVPAHRRALSRGASTLFRLVYPVTGVRDYTCGYRAYRAGLLRQAFARWGRDFVSEPGFSCMVDILLKLDRLGAVITEAPLILRYDRKPGESKMNVRRTILQTLKLLGRHRFGRVR
jgi:dolichol-phosphate mannosyltransferase